MDQIELNLDSIWVKIEKKTEINITYLRRQDKSDDCHDDSGNFVAIENQMQNFFESGHLHFVVTCKLMFALIFKK